MSDQKNHPEQNITPTPVRNPSPLESALRYAEAIIMDRAHREDQTSGHSSKRPEIGPGDISDHPNGVVGNLEELRRGAKSGA